MSFSFEWPRFSDQFHADAIHMLNNALNKGNKPPVIADKIEVVELEMGTQPPELEIRDIGDLTVDQFRGIFRMTYTGDAHIVLKTKVQANPLNHKQPDIHLMSGSRGMLAAKQPLVVPMLLRLSQFKLNSIITLVISKQKGITLVFKTDPLQNVDINSSFDNIAVIQKFIQKEIEGQLRTMFREDLPGIIHRLSQQWVKAKVEAPYLIKQPPPLTTRPPPPTRQETYDFETRSAPDLTGPAVASVGLQLHLLRQQSFGPLPFPRAPSVSSTRRKGAASVASTSSARSRRSQPPSAPAEPTASFPDLENFDPTYGLRPEGVPAKSGFTSFGRLFQEPSKGLADLAEASEEESFEGSTTFDGEGEEYSEYAEDAEYREDAGSFDVVEWEDFAPPPTTSSSSSDRGNGRPRAHPLRHSHTASQEYDTIPAVGGGTFTRPRVYHSQSLLQSQSNSPTPSPSMSRSDMTTATSQATVMQARPHLGVSRPASSYFSAHATQAPPLTRPRSMFDVLTTAGGINAFHSNRAISPDSMTTQFSRSSSGLKSSMTTSPSTDSHHDEHIYTKHLPQTQTPSTSSNFDAFRSGSPPTLHPSYSSKGQNHSSSPVILRPSLNNTSISQLSTLSLSNHTLSPYTRSLEHFTVRSVPPRGHVIGERVPLKGKRKRTFRLGGSNTFAASTPVSALGTALDEPPPLTPVPPGSEFDAGDMDRYFRSDHDYLDGDSRPDLPPAPSMTRRRPSHTPYRRSS